MKHPPVNSYWDSTGPNIYSQRDAWREQCEDLQELCGELLTELEEARQ